MKIKVGAAGAAPAAKPGIQTNILHNMIFIIYMVLTASTRRYIEEYQILMHFPNSCGRNKILDKINKEKKISNLTSIFCQS